MYSMIATGFGDGVAVVGDDGRFAERMDRAQLLRRAHVGLALIAHDLVGHAEFFEQPQHALRARIVEMMDGQHGVPPECAALVRRVVPAGTRKVEMATARLILPGMLLTILIYPGNISRETEEHPMNPASDTAYIAFDGDRCIASGDLREVARAAKADARPTQGCRRSSSSTAQPAARSISIFAARSRRCWRDCRPPDAAVTPEDAAVAAPARARPAETRRGRARGHAAAAALGLAGAATGGASVALRKLVEEARRANEDKRSHPARRGKRPIISCR